MGLFELLFIAVGLSMDAFAVAICKGLNMKKINYKHSIIIALFFGGFQGIMPLIGWFIGIHFEKYITSIDHWIAFILLAIIGANMIKEAFSEDDKEDATCDCDGPEARLNLKEIFVLAIATSIDALAVGITFAFLGANIMVSSSLISSITFIISFFGVLIGNKFGAKYKEKAAIAGGVILILMGLKILLEHLGILVL
jgi:putative Mn2+ efflux pump MntP